MQWKSIVGVCALLCWTASTAAAQSFTSTDVGNVGASGSAMVSGATWTVTGSGADIWGTADAFQFAHLVGPASGSITTRVEDLQAAQAFAKAGLMIRASLDASAAAVILDVKPDGWAEFMSRSAANSSMEYVTGRQLSFPAYLRLSWQGGSVTAWTSPDQFNWSVLAETGASLPAHEVGMAVSSHDNSQLATAHFMSTTVTALQPASWNGVDVGNVGLAGDASPGNGQWTVSGAGADVWGQHDAFRYVYRQTRINNQHVIVRVDSLSAANTFAKAGLMLRNTLDDSAATVVLDVRPGGQIEFMVRPSAGANMEFIGTATVSFPVWLQLNWTGDTDHATNVVASYSTDHVQWNMVGGGSQPLTLSDVYTAGAFMTSHDATSRGTAHFTGLSLLPSAYWSDDIGDTGLVGNASWDVNQISAPFQVEAAGSDIWGNADSFHFLHLVVDPNASGGLSQRIDLDASHPFAKAGVMYRDGLDPAAAMVIVDVKPDGGVEFMARLCHGCPVTLLKSVQIGLPAWGVLFRDGDTFTASVWDARLQHRTELGSVTVPMERHVPGYATVSHDPAHMAHAVYDDPPR